MTVIEQSRVPTPEQAAHLFLTPNRAKARLPQQRPPGARASSIPFGEGGALAAFEWGEGLPVLLVHGWEGSHADMDGFVAPLVAAGFRAVAMDLPGHGASTGTLAPIPLMAKAVRTVADAIGGAHALIAHSIGCAASMTALSRGLDVGRVVLLASPTNYRAQAEIVARFIGLKGEAREKMLTTANRLGAELEQIDFISMAPSMRAPALIMHSEDDTVCPIAPARDAAKFWRGATFKQLNGLGHMRLLGDEAVIADTVAFLSQPVR
jgi:pimeloyl-ACP methyl ester carboxylesterase